MTTLEIIELAAGVGLIGAGIFFYSRRSGDDSYGNQGGVILLIVGAIVTIHALGLFEYRPSQAELEAMQEGAR